MAEMWTQEGSDFTLLDDFSSYPMDDWLQIVASAPQSYAYTTDQILAGDTFLFTNYDYSVDLSEWIDPYENSSPSHTQLSTASTINFSASPQTSVSVDPTIVPTPPAIPDDRPFEDCLFEFEGARPAAAGAKRRRAYTKERRKAVGQTRKVGACVRCKLLKISCRLELPCAGCLKACKNPKLGQSLCHRPKLLDARFTTDLWGRRNNLSWMQRNVTSLRGPRRTVKICLVNLCDLSKFTTPSALNAVPWIWDGGVDGPWKDSSCLEVEVQDFEPKHSNSDVHTLDVSLKGRDKTITISTPPEYYAIPVESLPSLEALESWVLETTLHSRRAFFASGFHGTFLSLAVRYYECKRALPLSELMRKAVKLSCLHAIWCSALPQPRQSHEEPHRYVSKAVHQQIAAIVTTGIVDLEVEVLSKLQDLVFRAKGPGKENMLPIWTCLWLLMLTYRRTITGLTTKLKPDSDLRLAQHMYDMLVSTYSGLFKPSSPISLNWLKDEVFGVFGHDYRITHCMGTLKTEFGYIYDGDQCFQKPYDALLRSLVLKNEQKLDRKAREAAWDFPESQWAKPKYDPGASGFQQLLDVMTRQRQSSWCDIPTTPEDISLKFI